jgi:vacuolar-type H+-ATPase subunit H
MEESKNGKPMIEDALKELDQIISELSEEANKLKQKIFQVDLSDTTDVLKIFSRMEALCSEIKGIKMTIMLQLDYIKDQKEYEKSLKT